eukprot:TRINITY_DN4316_c0_g1_i2.p1 TRINITY_DN4316_c0_g1~~TRINITY_DN4316_c0_g1_i2.p1  ORF type:complete len:1181 (+),score=436.13 TRINITY_DN4316_c0_g1_i2:73-3615(+)
MKFGKTLADRANEAWKPHYIDYNHLKNILTKLKQNVNGENLSFAEELDKQIVQASSFCRTKIEQSQRKLIGLLKLKEQTLSDSNYSSSLESISSVISSFILFGNELYELKRFSELNKIALVKILKKHDKINAELQSEGKSIKLEVLDRTKEEPFISMNEIEELRSKVSILIQNCEDYKNQSLIFQLASSPRLEGLPQLLSRHFDRKELDSFVNVLSQEKLFNNEKEERMISLLIAKIASKGSNDFLKAILERIAAFPSIVTLFRDEQERNLAHISSLECLEELIRWSKGLSEENRFDFNALDSEGRTALHSQSEKNVESENQVNSFLSLLKETQKSLEVEDFNGLTPLHYASQSSALETVKLLLKSGAKHDAKTKNQKTPLHLACYHEEENTAIFLLQNGADPKALDYKGQNPLHVAARMGRVSIAKALTLSDESLSTVQDKEGNTPIHYASFHGEPKVIEAIVEILKDKNVRKKALDLQNLNGMTPLHIAASERQTQCGELLAKLGADLEITDDTEWTAETYAAYVGDLRLADLIQTKSRALDNMEVGRNLTESPQLNLEKENSSPLSPKSPNLRRYQQNLMSCVTFKISALTKGSEYVAVVGERKILGSYNPLHALPLSLENPQDLQEDEMERTWIGSVFLPAGVSTRYRYIICQGSELLRWETLPDQRYVKPSLKNVSINDGTFGRQRSRGKEGEKEEEFVESGWLIQQYQLRLRLWSEVGGAVLYDPQVKSFKLSLSTQEPLSKVSNVSFPLPHHYSEEIVFTGSDLTRISCVTIDASSVSGPLIGRATVHPMQFLENKGNITCTLMSPTLQPIGYVKMEYLVIKPFEHINIVSALDHPYWKATTLIGHRGGGAEEASLKNNRRHVHIRENTLLSFRTAASLGAEYVEFDVQLTKDEVPVIYHDEIISAPDPDSNVKVPITNLTLKQFKALHVPRSALSSRSHEETAVVKEVAKKVEAKSISKSKSSENLKALMKKEEIKKVPNETSRDHEPHIHDPLPTLEECFRQLPISTGFNIEIKYPQPEQAETHGLKPFERNMFIDRILKTVFDHAGQRKIMFSSFDPDICLLLKFKQPRYPVFFLTRAGTKCFSDKRVNSLREAVRFAKASRLMGIVSNSTPIVRAPQVIQEVKRAGLVLCTYGDLNNDMDVVSMQERLGTDAVIVDHVAHVSKNLRGSR